MLGVGEVQQEVGGTPGELEGGLHAHPHHRRRLLQCLRALSYMSSSRVITYYFYVYSRLWFQMVPKSPGLADVVTGN